ncbi:MAG: hypothetical protein AAGA60_18490 [Cyanobacteria bacterium P01_E01_bin.42]
MSVWALCLTSQNQSDRIDGVRLPSIPYLCGDNLAPNGKHKSIHLTR